MSHRGILIVYVGICCVLCFAKQNFEIIIDRAELSDVDSEIIRVEMVINKYNRTCKAYSTNMTLLKDLNYDVTVEIKAFALYSNEYRRTPMNYKRQLCDLYKLEYLWIKREITKYSNYPSQCPLLAGDYYVKDFVPNGAVFPATANFPWNKCMLSLRFFYKNKIFTTFKIYVTLDHDVELKRMG